METHLGKSSKSHIENNTISLAILNACETPFMHELIHSAQYSKHTIAAYGRDVGQFLQYLNSMHTLDSLISLDYEIFTAFLSAKQLAAKTVRRKIVSLSKFCQFLINQNLISQDTTKELSLPKLSKRLPNAVAPDELTNLLDDLANNTDKSDPLAVRDWTIAELLYSTGARVAELAAMDLLDLNIESGEIRVIGKGNKERIVHVGSKANKALTYWLERRNDMAKDNSPALFINKHGKRLSIRSIQLRLKALGVGYDANLNLHPHRMRHSFGGHIVQSGGDLRAVQEMLGHTSLAATQIYTHLDFQSLAKVYDQAHPHAKRMQMQEHSKKREISSSQDTLEASNHLSQETIEDS